MNDRELLELAAKAAGIEIWFSREWHNSGECQTGTPAHPRGWNPLIDDGDALRLAVDLRMCVRCYEGSIIVGGGGASVEIHDVSDRAAATRLGIVRVAALMGAEA